MKRLTVLLLGLFLCAVPAFAGKLVHVPRSESMQHICATQQHLISQPLRDGVYLHLFLDPSETVDPYRQSSVVVMYDDDLGEILPIPNDDGPLFDSGLATEWTLEFRNDDGATFVKKIAIGEFVRNYQTRRNEDKAVIYDAPKSFQDPDSVHFLSQSAVQGYKWVPDPEDEEDVDIALAQGIPDDPLAGYSIGAQGYNPVGSLRFTHFMKDGAPGDSQRIIADDEPEEYGEADAARIAAEAALEAGSHDEPEDAPESADASVTYEWRNGGDIVRTAREPEYRERPTVLVISYPDAWELVSKAPDAKRGTFGNGLPTRWIVSFRTADDLLVDKIVDLDRVVTPNLYLYHNMATPDRLVWVRESELAEPEAER